MGLPLGALLLAHDGHDLVWVGLPRADSLGTRRATRTFGDRVSVMPQLNARTLRSAREAGANFLVSWFWTRRVPPVWLRAFEGRTLGVHPSLLPRHRGPDPIFWAIDCGDTVTGVSAHRLEEAYDVGSVLGPVTVPIDAHATGWGLAKRLDRPGLALLRATVGHVASGAELAAIPQDESQATHAPSLDDDDLAIVWSWDASRILLRIRAASPWPGAWTELGGEVVTVVRACLAEEPPPRALLAGEAWLVGDRVFVRAGQRALELEKVRLEDERELSGAALAALVRAGTSVR